MDEKLPPFFQLSDSDHGGFAVVVALCTIVVSSTVSAIRCVVATRQRVGFQLDDATFYMACFLGNASSICIYRAVLVGLGKQIQTLSPQSLDSYYKLIYGAQLTSILSMTSAKISVVLLIKRITQTDNRAWNCTLILVWVWGIFSFLAIAFQCQMPKPWVFVPAQCKTHGSLQYPIIVLNIITDAILGTGMLPTIWRLNIARDTRVTVMTLFGIRLVVSGIGIGQLVSVARSIGKVDQTWVNLPLSVWLMMITHTSIITATIPRTHSFWASLQTGKAGTEITEQEYELSGGSSQPSALGGSGLSSRNPFSKFSKRKKGISDHIKTMSWSTSRNRELSRSRGKTQSRIAEERLQRQASQEPLQLVPRTKSDLNTRVYCDEAGNEASGGRSDDDTSQTSLRQSSQGGVWMEREVVMEVEYLKKP